MRLQRQNNKTEIMDERHSEAKCWQKKLHIITSMDVYFWVRVEPESNNFFCTVVVLASPLSSILFFCLFFWFCS